MDTKNRTPSQAICLSARSSGSFLLRRYTALSSYHAAYLVADTGIWISNMLSHCLPPVV